DSELHRGPRDPHRRGARRAGGEPSTGADPRRLGIDPRRQRVPQQGRCAGQAARLQHGAVRALLRLRARRVSVGRFAAWVPRAPAGERMAMPGGKYSPAPLRSPTWLVVRHSGRRLAGSRPDGGRVVARTENPELAARLYLSTRAGLRQGAVWLIE